MRKRTLAKRGRPRGKYNSRFYIRLLEYLALISMKYEIDSSEFFASLVYAWKHQKSTCGELSIKCRKRTRDYAIFLITSSHRVVAQFSMPKRVLQETNPLSEFTHARSLGRPPVGELKVSRLRVRDLRAGMKRISVKARVLEMLEPRLVFTRFGGCANVANALIADETGVMKLSLWNEQIHAVSVDDIIQIENARVAVFRGERQLRIGRHGKLRIVRDISFPSAQEIKKNLLRYSKCQV